MKTPNISIIGCGWLGKPLAKSLSHKHQVLCYSRKDISDDSLNYIYKPDANNAFWQSDIFIIAINTKDDYLNTLKNIATLANKEATIIMMSSISVYREFDTKVDEKANITKKALQKEAEELMQSLRKNLIILRLGGLMGYDRVAGRWKKVSKFSDGIVNYVHRDDVINITTKLIDSNIKNEIFNVVAPMYPLRSEVHTKNSKKFAFKLGTYEGMTHRKVLSDAIIKKLNYTFLYPNPLEFWD